MQFLWERNYKIKQKLHVNKIYTWLKFPSQSPLQQMKETQQQKEIVFLETVSMRPVPRPFAQVLRGTEIKIKPWYAFSILQIIWLLAKNIKNLNNCNKKKTEIRLIRPVSKSYRFFWINCSLMIQKLNSFLNMFAQLPCLMELDGAWTAA